MFPQFSWIFRAVAVLFLKSFVFVFGAALSVVALAAGELDGSFGSGTGVVRPTFLSPAGVTFNLPPRSVAVSVGFESYGRIVTHSVCSSLLDANPDFPSVPNYYHCIGAYKPDGTTDTSFDARSSTPGRKVIPSPGTVNRGEGFALERSGRLSFVLPDPSSGFGFEMREKASSVAKLQEDGLFFDPTFGVNGIAKTAALPPPYTTSEFGMRQVVSVLRYEFATGRNIAVGYCNPSALIICIAKYDASGQPDTSFNGSGIVVLSQAYLRSPAALSESGEIFVTGSALYNNIEPFPAVWKLAQNGTRPPDFGREHRSLPAGQRAVIFDDSDPHLLTNGDRITTLAIETVLMPDTGGLLLLNLCANATANTKLYCLVRLKEDGALDRTFGDRGYVMITDTPQGQPNNDNSRTELSRGAVLQPDGKVLLPGSCLSSGFVVNGYLCVGRRNADGSADTTFGVNGWAVTPIRGVAYAAAVQSDKKILVAGSCGDATELREEGCLLRLIGKTQRRAALDADGDGVLMTVTDMLLNYRFAMGFTGPSLLDGVVLPDLATRRTPEQIAAYMQEDVGGVMSEPCTLDIDGDGVISTGTDLLIAMRIARGVRGDAALGGVTFPLTATRKS